MESSVTELLDKMPLWGVLLASLLITLLSMEFGFGMGKRMRGRLTGDQTIHAGPVATACFSLLAFMLAITFGAAQSRVTEWKHLVMEEANAIGTAYLRADLLPSTERVETRRFLREYATLRSEAVREGTRQEVEQAMHRSEELQSELWTRAVDVAGQQPTPISAALFVQALNDLFDLYEKRITVGIHYRLPGIVWMVLYGLAILAMAVGGYDSGSSGSRRTISITLSAAMAFSVVLMLVVGLDRPHRHLSAASEATMLSLEDDTRRSMEPQP